MESDVQPECIANVGANWRDNVGVDVCYIDY